MALSPSAFDRDDWSDINDMVNFMETCGNPELGSVSNMFVSSDASVTTIPYHLISDQHGWHQYPGFIEVSLEDGVGTAGAEEQTAVIDAVVAANIEPHPLSRHSTVDRPAINPSTRVSKASPIPSQLWERHRATITELYITNDHELHEVRRLLREQHGFDATEQQYKNKFRRWDIRKNYSQEQKREVVLLQESRGNSREAPRDGAHRTVPIIVNRKELKPSRIERYRRNKAPMATLREFPQVSSFQPRQSAENHNLELYLLEVKYYSKWCMLPPNQKHFRRGNGTVDFLSCILDARRSLPWDQNVGFAFLNRACFLATRVFSRCELPLLIDLLELCGEPAGWEAFADVRFTLLRYLGSLAERLLSSQHPVSKTVQLLIQGLARVDALDQVTRLVFEQNRFSHLEDTPLSLEFQTYLYGTNFNENTAEFAIRNLSRTLKQAKRPSSSDRNIVHRAKYTLASAHARHGDIRETEDLLLEIIADSVQDFGRENGSVISIHCCNQLGLLYANDGREEEAELYLRLALEGGLEVWGDDDVHTGQSLRSLEIILEGSSRYGDLEKLHQDYAAVCASRDRWRLDPATFHPDWLEENQTYFVAAMV